MVIVLIGPMGCGKTTIGKLLSSRLGWRFADGDDYHPKENRKKMGAGFPLDDEDRLPWLRTLQLERKKIHFIGAGVSGGEEGAMKGPAIMPGGTASAWPHLAPIFLAVAAEAEDGARCCAWMGEGGAGHHLFQIEASSIDLFNTV